MYYIHQKGKDLSMFENLLEYSYTDYMYDQFVVVKRYKTVKTSILDSLRLIQEGAFNFNKEQNYEDLQHERQHDEQVSELGEELCGD